VGLAGLNTDTFRGISPLLVAILSAWFASEWLNPVQWSAVIIITTGLLAIAWHPDIKGRLSRQALSWGLATSVLIACYTVIDGLGVREAGNPLSYIVWLFALSPLASQVASPQQSPMVW